MHVAVVTATRAEYGLLSNLLKSLHANNQFELSIVVTGAHLSSYFGNTIDEILDDKLPVKSKIHFELKKDDPEYLTKSLGKALSLFGKELKKLHPDLLIILGDRYEMIAPVTAAVMQKIPIAHIHGGEKTTGAIDNKIRNAITQMSDFHFTATGLATENLQKMGICGKRTHFVGSLGIDKIHKMKFINRVDLENELGFVLKKKNILITFHPETLSTISGVEQVNELLFALEKFPKLGIIMTLSNADQDGQKISERIKEFSRGKQNIYISKNLGQLRYLSLLSTVDVVVGNSSSGIIEAPEIGTLTLNIGERQNGREMALTITNVRCERKAIENALLNCLKKTKLVNINRKELPYGKLGATKMIMHTLESIKNNSVENKI